MKSCNAKILDLFYNATNTGRIVKPEAIGRFGDNNDGLVIELSWRVHHETIIDAKFRAFANPNAIAICSLMTSNFVGKTLEEVMNIDESVIEQELGELLPEYLEVYDAVKEAMADAYNYYLKRFGRIEDAVDNQEDHSKVDNQEIIAFANVVEDDVDEFDEYQQEYSTENNTQTIFTFNTLDEKRGRGRPRKPVDENAVIELGEKRGRGRPRKPVDPNAIVEVGEKRGRGRPKKIIDESEIVEVGEKRGRGRPRKPVDENAVIELGEKRGRGRPRKIVDENEVVEVGEKRGRGRPRKPVDPNAIVEVGEKRGRGRPSKQPFKYNLPSDLDEVIGDEVVESLIGGSNDKDNNSDIIITENETVASNVNNTSSYIQTLNLSNQEDVIERSASISSNIEQFNHNVLEDDIYNTDFSNDMDEVVSEEDVINDEVDERRGRGRPRKEVSFEELEQLGEKRGRGRPRKPVDESAIIEESEKRGRGRPRKIVDETNEESHEKRGRGRPRNTQPINSLTRSLSPTSHVMGMHNTQDIVFASKNVTTTNININVTKTTETNDKVDEYSHNINISKVEQNSNVAKPINMFKDEIDESEVKLSQDNQPELKSNNTFEQNFDIENDFEVEEDFDEVDTSKVKDEAPKGGIEDLLKALLEED